MRQFCFTFRNTVAHQNTRALNGIRSFVLWKASISQHSTTWFNLWTVVPFRTSDYFKSVWSPKFLVCTPRLHVLKERTHELLPLIRSYTLNSVLTWCLNLRLPQNDITNDNRSNIRFRLDRTNNTRSTSHHWHTETSQQLTKNYHDAYTTHSAKFWTFRQNHATETRQRQLNIVHSREPRGNRNVMTRRQKETTATQSQSNIECV